MANHIVLVNTHFQFLTILNLKLQEFREESWDIVISDEISGYQDIAEKLREQRIFRNVYTIETRDIVHACGKKDYLKKISYIMLSESHIKKFFPYKRNKYDYFWFDNVDSLVTHLLFEKFSDINKNLKAIFFEECIGCCHKKKFDLREYKTFRLLGKKQNVLHKAKILDNIEAYYCFLPELVSIGKEDTKVRKMPVFSSENVELGQCIDEIYSLEELEDRYEEKYIFFEESFISNPGEEIVEDFQIVSQIAEKVGKENLIVKRHPRNKEDRFGKCGIKVNKNFSVPWEAVMLKQNFTDKIFITISSTAAFSIKVYFSNQSKVYVLSKAVKNRLERWNEFEKTVNNLNEILGEEEFVVVEDLEGFIKNL